MKPAYPQLDSRADLDTQFATLRQSGGDIRQVQWQGQPAWQLLAGMARLRQRRHPQ